MTAPSSVLLPPGGQRIMAILAHPDDAEFLCGGTIACLAEEGCDIHYLLVTRGDKGGDDPEMTSERLAVIREKEQREAATTLGVQTITFLEGYYDGEVEATLALRRELTLYLRQWRPDVVLTFDPWKPDEIHPDHRAVGVCAFDALNASRGAMYYPEQIRNGVTAHKVRDVYFFSTDRPNHWANITSTIDRKIAALRCHTSQMKNFDPDEYAKRKARQAGGEHRYKYAEAFHHYALP